MAGICNLCGLPEELCICQEIAKEATSNSNFNSEKEVWKDGYDC